jgi:hypothetical protein
VRNISVASTLDGPVTADGYIVGIIHYMARTSIGWRASNVLPRSRRIFWICRVQPGFALASNSALVAKADESIGRGQAPRVRPADPVVRSVS